MNQFTIRFSHWFFGEQTVQITATCKHQAKQKFYSQFKKYTGIRLLGWE